MIWAAGPIQLTMGASYSRIMETTTAAPRNAVYVRTPRASARRAHEVAAVAPQKRPASVSVQPKLRSELASRVLNVAVASIALVLLSPVILLAAVAIKLTSRGPVLYRQVRVGIDERGGSRGDPDNPNRRAHNMGGRVFSIYKMRTMYVDAEQRSGAVWATQGDPRVTPVGRVLRKFRIDEIPQLLNVIQDTMSVVGPRPERPSIFAKLSQDIAEYSVRQRAKPGITGLAQISHSYDTCVDDVRAKVRYDLQYLEKQSVVHDVSIMVRTLPVMLFRRGGW